MRAFAVDCEPLDKQRLWLVTGLELSGLDGSDLAVIVPGEVATALEDQGWGSAVAPMPPDNVLVVASSDVLTRRAETEALVLSAYASAMAD